MTLHSWSDPGLMHNMLHVCQQNPLTNMALQRMLLFNVSNVGSRDMFMNQPWAISNVQLKLPKVPVAYLNSWS